MKILLVNPKTPKNAGLDLFDGALFGAVINGKPNTTFHNSIPIALPTLAAVTPPPHVVKIVDEMIDQLDFQEPFDIVGITAMTYKAPRAYEIAKAYREKGIPVIMGGIHATVCPDEAAQHVDSVVIGEAEEIWPTIIEDLAHNNLQKRYEADAFPDISKLPPPRWDLVNYHHYLYYTVQTTRGCPNQCKFCTVTKINGRKIRKKTPEQVIREIDICVHQYKSQGFNLKDKKDGKLKRFSGIFFFTDDNFAIHRKHAMDICNAIKAYQEKNKLVFFWFTQVNYETGLDHELLQAMKDANCVSLFMGVESLETESLKSMKKTMNDPALYAEAIRNTYSYGIPATVSTIIGNDTDSPTVVEGIVRFFNDYLAYRALLNILTPYPGTVLYDEMVAQNRMITHDPALFNIRNVVHRPAHITADELQGQFVRLCKEVIGYEKIFPRLKHNIAHSSRWSIPVYMRPFFYLLMSASAILLSLKGKIPFSTLKLFQKLLFSSVIMSGDFPNCIYCAESLDFDAFARSEEKRFKKSANHYK